MYPIGTLVSTPLIARMTSCCGRPNLMTAGVFFMGLTFIIFGLSFHIKNKMTFIYIHMVNRLLQGTSSALIWTAVYSIVTTYYSDRQEIIIGYVEAGMGFGNSLGPALGSGLYALGGHNLVFHSFGGVFVLCAIFVKRIFKPEADDMAVLSEGPTHASIVSDQLEDISEPPSKLDKRGTED